MSLNETLLRRVGHAENCKEEKNENRDHSALSRGLKQRQRVIRSCGKAEVREPK